VTYVLKSDVMVSDPQGLLPVLTPHGMAHADLGAYYFGLSADGYDMSAAEFAAFSDFISTLDEAGIWPAMLAVAPLFGVNFENVRRQLRHKLAPAKMSGQHGLGFSDFETSGGKSLGVAPRAFSNNNSPAFGLGITGAELTARWGLCAYVNDDGSANPSATAGKNIFGAYYGAGGGFQTNLEVYYDTASGNETIRARNASTLYAQSANLASIKGILAASATETRIAVNMNGAEIAAQQPVAWDPSVGLQKELSFLSKTPADGATISQGWNGRVRFFSLDDGSLSNSQRATLGEEVETLMDALGRTFG